MAARTRILVAIALAWMAGMTVAQAQTYPSKPVRIVVPFAAGGPVDFIARALGNQLKPLLGQPIVVDNRAGAGGIVAAEHVIKSPPDGYTVLIAGAGGHSVRPSITTLRYDPMKELPAVTTVATAPQIFVSRAGAGWRSLAEAIGYARSNPGRVNFGSIAMGSITHLAGELLKREAGIKVVDVPYNSGAPAVQAMLGEQIDLLTADLSAVLPHVQAGKLTGLAVTSAGRAPLLPNVPSAAEVGYPSIVAENVYGLFVAAGTPADFVAKLNQATVAALKTRELQDQLVKAGFIPTGSTSAEFDAYLRADSVKWGGLAKSLGIRLD